MRIGVFGGTFDPVHLGHLILAEQCREQGRLDEVWFVPAARPPHKTEAALTPFAQRVEMLNLAIAGQPAFRVEELEKDRPGLSFTAVTLEELSAPASRPPVVFGARRRCAARFAGLACAGADRGAGRIAGDASSGRRGPGAGGVAFAAGAGSAGESDRCAVDRDCQHGFTAPGWRGPERALPGAASRGGLHSG